MPRECTVCSHPESLSINEAIVGVGEEGKKSNRTIAKQFGVHYSAVQRHKEHIPTLLVKALEAEQAAAADDLLKQVRALQTKTLNLLLRAEGAGDLRTALSGIREARGNVELLAKLRGDLDERPVVNILVAPQWIALRTELLHVLEAHPEARRGVLRALGEASDGGA